MTNMWPPYPHELATKTALRMLSDEPLTFDEFYKQHTGLGEQEWKHEWKLNYMKRLNKIAETAWQNNLVRMAKEADIETGWSSEEEDELV